MLSDSQIKTYNTDGLVKSSAQLSKDKVSLSMKRLFSAMLVWNKIHICGVIQDIFKTLFRELKGT